uniref:RING-H2 finger protein ATL68 n=1 Tax=Anthurium amnicola TaxID=1678845 RepID=A0A1D1Y9J9_9ARAE
MSTGGGGNPSSATTSSSSSFLQNLSGLGVGYAIAIALGLLVLLSTLLLVSYVCCRASSARTRRGAGAGANPNGASSPAAGSGGVGVGLPHIIFVAEDEEEEAAGRSHVPGLDQAAINSYPKFPFSKSGKAAAGGGGEAVCAVCLCEYREGEMLRMMPDCRHCFHLPCIDAWLRLNASCPVCRTSPMPTPISTPLSELVPLSHFAADRRRR